MEIDPGALKSLRRIDKPIRDRIVAAIDKLAEDPRPSGCRAMKGAWKGHTRIRVADDWRVIYRIDDGKLFVLVVEVGNRGDIY